MKLSLKTRNALNKYGAKICKKAYEMCELEGNGARSIAYEFNMTTRQADAAINAHRELISS